MSLFINYNDTNSMKYFIANWKANKNLSETQSWVTEFLKQKLPNNEIQIIICPPFPLIYPLKKMLEGQTIFSVGSQDISAFEGGKYTGEVTGHNLDSIAQYTILGHSERKKYFHETENDLKTKYVFAKKYGIKSIYCIATADITYPSDLDFLCYEPPEAISSGDGRGNYVSLENVLAAKLKLKLPSQTKFIYGGSVNKDTISQYLKSNEIDGFLIGGASLDPLHFFQIVSKK